MKKDTIQETGAAGCSTVPAPAGAAAAICRKISVIVYLSLLKGGLYVIVEAVEKE